MIDELTQIKQNFNILIESNQEDYLKLEEYYKIEENLQLLFQESQNPAVKELMISFMNHPCIQETMFRIADEECFKYLQQLAYIQEVKILEVAYKPSRRGRQYLQEIQKQDNQNNQPEQQEIQELIIQQQEQEIQFEEQIQSPPKKYVEVKTDRLSELINKSQYEFEQTRLDEAYKIVIQAKQQFDLSQNQDYLDYANDIIYQYEYMIKNLKELDSDGWSCDGVKKGISVKYKFPAGTNTASMLMETEIPVNAVRVLTLVNEVDLNYLWVPFCKRTYVNKVLNRACKVCTSEMYFPIIPDRECVFMGTGYDRLQENGTIVLLSKSVDQDKEYLVKNGIEINEKTKFVRMNIHYYIFEIRPKDENTCSIRAITNVDPRISFIPNSVLAYTGRKFAHILVQKIVYYAKNFENSLFYPRFQEHKEFYDWLQQKVNAFLQSCSQQ